jgi:hypothetical protein
LIWRDTIFEGRGDVNGSKRNFTASIGDRGGGGIRRGASAPYVWRIVRHPRPPRRRLRAAFHEINGLSKNRGAARVPHRLRAGAARHENGAAPACRQRRRRRALCRRLVRQVGVQGLLNVRVSWSGPQKDIDAAVKAMKKVGVSGAVKNMSSTKWRSV